MTREKKRKVASYFKASVSGQLEKSCLTLVETALKALDSAAA